MAELKSSLGLDIGTSTIIAARLDEEDNPIFRLHRDAFFQIVPVSDINRKTICKSMSEKKIDYIIRDDSIFVVGQHAIDLANERHKNARRPLHKGVISARERDALPMIKHILQKLIGPPLEKNETCFYSVPSQPVDSDELNVVYHEQVFDSFLKGLGYKPHSLNEGEAIVYSELLDSGLTGLSMGFGAGMVNVCMCSMGENILSFSVSRAGDYIDHESAIALDLTDSIIQAEKEASDDQGNPLLNVKNYPTDNKIYEAIAIHYRALIRYVLKQIVYELEHTKDVPVFTEPIPVVISGGTTLPIGFLDLFKECLAEIKLPIPTSDVRHCKDSLLTVAKGALFAATL